MRAWALVPAALFVEGAGLVFAAVISGGATVGVALVVPFVVGRSLEFVLGVVLVLAGFLTLPLAFPRSDVEGSEPGDAPAGSTGGGGIVIVGPVPILFGSWRSVSARTRLLLAIVAAVIFALVVLAVLLGLA